MAQSPHKRSHLVAWDIVETSLDEAEFLWTRWEAALHSHDHDLTTVWDRVEDRLAGALDGLRVGGDEAIGLYLSDAIDGGEPGRVASAAHALAAEASPQALERLQAALGSAPPAKLGPLRRAVELVESPGLIPGLRAALADATPAAIAALLDAGRFRWLDPGPDVVGLSTHESPEVQRAAVAASRYATNALARACIDRGLRASHAAVRAAAIEAGVALALRVAWDECRAVVAAQADECRSLLLLVGLLGTPSDHEALVKAVSNPALRRDAVWALGFAGRRDGADVCVELMRQDLLPGLAAEAFCAISGLDLEREGLRVEPPRPEVSETDELPVPGPDDGLPLPDPAGVARWWGAARGRFAPDQRYLAGQPVEAGLQQGLLESGPLRRRHPIGLELAIRSQGRYRVATGAFSPEQRRQLSTFAALPPDLRRQLHGTWVTTY